MPNKTSLERQFQKAKTAPPGDCPLPEPGRGAPAIEHPSLTHTRPQPDGYDYDQTPNGQEQQRFIKNLLEQAKADPQVKKWAKDNGYL